MNNKIYNNIKTISINFILLSVIGCANINGSDNSYFNNQDIDKIKSNITKYDINSEINSIKESIPKQYSLDKILAVIYDPEETKIITQSDLRAGLDGAKRTLDQAIFEALMLLDAKKLHLDDIKDEEIDKLLASLQKQHNLTKEQLEEVFKDLGLTVEQGREELKAREIRDRIMYIRIKDKAHVDKSEIEKYYEDNPITEPGVLTISEGFIPWTQESKFDDKIKGEELDLIKKNMESGDIGNKDIWGKSFKLQEDELPEAWKHIKDLDSNSFIITKETDNGVNLLHIISKKPKRIIPLEDKEQEISAKLRSERYTKALEDYKNSLLDSLRSKDLIKVL